MKNSKGLSEEQQKVAKRATNLESLEYLGEIKKGIEDGKLVETTVSTKYGKKDVEYNFKVMNTEEF